MLRVGIGTNFVYTQNTLPVAYLGLTEEGGWMVATAGAGGFGFPGEVEGRGYPSKCFR